MNIILIILGIVCIAFIYMYFENKYLSISKYEIKSGKIPQEFDKSTFLLMSDLHNNIYGKKNKTLIEKIRGINPDYILIAGDMLVGSIGAKTDVSLELIKELSKCYPIYYGNGNHEQRLGIYPETKDTSYQDYVNELKKLNVHLLVNENEAIIRKQDKILIHGLQIHEDYYKKVKRPDMPKEYLKNTLGSCNEKVYNILIAHNPMYFKEYVSWGADLIVSGHVHGGMIRLPFIGGVISPQYQLFPTYDSGLFKEQNRCMVLSRGLGMHTIRIRFLNKPELVVIKLKREIQ